MQSKTYFNKLCLYLIVIQFIIPCFLFARPKVGVVLSGGGARGIAHIGVLQRLEELKVPIDYIGGTSFGALVASFYSAGYTPKEIEKIVANFEWEQAFLNSRGRLQYYFYERKEQEANLIKVKFEDWEIKLPNALSSSQVIINELLLYFTRANYISKKNFLNLRTPLLISATDIVNGDNKIFKQGDLVKILQASLSVPLLFPPVEIDSLLYVDGGVTNNLPIQAMKNMGAEYIIASNTTHYLFEKKELESALKIADQLINIMMFSKIEDELKQANIIIRPDVQHIDNTEFTRWEDLLQAGREIPEKIIDSLKIYNYEALQASTKLENYYYPEEIVFQGSEIYAREEMLNLFVSNQKMTIDSIKAKINNKFVKNGYVLTEISAQKTGDDSLKIKIYNGKVRNIEITGNRITKSFVIGREIKTKSGEIFNINKMISDVKRVYSTNYFETVSYSLNRVNKYEVDIILKVKEKPYGFIRAGVNYNTEDRSSAFLSMGDDNLFGHANSINIFAHFGNERKFGFKFMDDRIFDTHLNCLLEAYFKEDLDIEDEREWNIKLATGIFDDRRLGVFRTILDYKISNLVGQGRTVGLGLEAVFDNYDKYPYPRKGLYRKVSYTNFNKKIGSKYNFQNFNLKNNFYITPFGRITFCGNLLLKLNSTREDEIPLIRQTTKKPGDTFFGFHNNEIIGEDIFYLTGQLRINLINFSINDPRKNLYLFLKSGIGEFGKINNMDEIWEVFEQKKNLGYSIGLEVSTIAGPVILSYQGCSKRNFWYFSIGYDF